MGLRVSVEHGSHWLSCLTDYASVGRSHRHKVVLFLCVFLRILFATCFPCPLKVKRWNTILSWNEIGGFWIGSIVWSFMLFTLNAVFPCPKSVKDQAAYNGLLVNLTVPSVLQGRQWNWGKPWCQRYTGYPQASQHDLLLWARGSVAHM